MSVTTPLAHSGPEGSQKVLDSPRSSLRFSTNPYRIKKKWPLMLFISRYAMPMPSLHASCFGRLYVTRTHRTPPKCQAAGLGWHMLAQAAVYWNRGLWFCNVKWRPFLAARYETCTLTAIAHADADLCNFKRRTYRQLFNHSSSVVCISEISLFKHRHRPACCLSKNVLGRVSWEQRSALLSDSTVRNYSKGKRFPVCLGSFCFDF